jgi:glycine/D-amino acid oxidase-like deaminating enzyme
MSDLAGNSRRTSTQSARVAVIGGGIVGASVRILAVLCFDTERGRSNLAVANRRHYTLG